MNRKPIGVFDSGLGGLTAVKELIKLLPNEDIIYFGDTSRVPYGAKSKETIIRYAEQDLNFLETFDVKACLVACGTASAVAIDKLEDNYSFPVFGVIESTVRAALASTSNKKIGIIGTPATVKSDAYAKKIAQMDKACQTLSVACPLFVPLVENGHIAKDDEITKQVVRLYLSQIKDFGADTVILGCTHYPIIANTIGEFMGEGVTLINSGKEAAKSIYNYLSRNDLLSDNQTGKCKYFVSDSVEGFETLGGIFMNCSINGDVTKIDIEKY